MIDLSFGKESSLPLFIGKWVDLRDCSDVLGRSESSGHLERYEFSLFAVESQSPRQLIVLRVQASVGEESHTVAWRLACILIQIRNRRDSSIKNITIIIVKVLTNILPAVRHEQQVRGLVIVEVTAKIVVVKFPGHNRTIGQGSHIENAVLSTIVIC